MLGTDFSTTLAKSILSVESARSLGWATATITRFSTDTVRAPARAPFSSYTRRTLQD